MGDWNGLLDYCTKDSPFTRLPVDILEHIVTTESQQEALMIDGQGQKYRLEPNHEIPSCIKDDEILVKIITVGLNPIDWKGPDYGFGLPCLPWINGRDFAGVVIKASASPGRIRVGDVILSPSTDYRDIRKAAFQQYAVTTEHNAARVPASLPVQNGAVVGVAFVAAAIALGVSLGVDFESRGGALQGPDLLRLCGQASPDQFADDVLDECLYRIPDNERAKTDDWLAIWGASATTGYIVLQLAKIAKLRVICVADVARHGERLLAAGADLLVDRLDSDRAVTIIRSVTRGRLRFGLDTVGKESATKLQECLCQQDIDSRKSHLVGLTGLPKLAASNVVHHRLPIKIFHDVPSIGESLMTWLERLLVSKSLSVPDVESVHGGLQGINEALKTMRGGSLVGKRMAVALNKISLVPVS